jgi:uncharacterized membrane protein
MDSFLTFIGRFHPLIVHLPIGFILLALLLEFSRNKFKEAEKVLRFIMLWVIISGLFSIATGYFQYLQEGYLWETIQAHFYLGLITLLLSIGFYIFLKGGTILNQLPRLFFSLGLLLSIVITGHLGGNITHGEDHLTEPLKELSSTVLGIEKEENEFSLNEKNYREQPIYSGIIAPILSKKCVSCHNTKRTKGGLQMHTYAAFQKGGKNGPIVNYDNPELSELFVRIHLPLEQKKHMPPKSKKQLTKAEIKLMSYWIEVGAPEEQTLGQIGIERNLIEPFLFKEEERFYPELELDAPDPETIKILESKGIIVSPVKRESNLLTLSSLNAPKFSVQQLQNLEGIKEQLVSIDLSYSSVNDSVFIALTKFPNLVQIKLNHTGITGDGIGSLSKLKNLKKLYMVETALKGSELSSIQKFPSIEQVFVFQSNRNLIEKVELTPRLQSIIEFGDYLLPKLPNEENND